MLFTSFTFLLFLTAVVAVYFICPVRFRYLVLLAASLVFYGIAGVQFLPFILLTAALSYGAARMIDNENQACAKELAELAGNKEAVKQRKALSKTRCRRYMIIALAVILGYLGYTKFARGVFNFVARATGNADSWSASALFLIVPLGISYYSFSTVGYVLDIYWKRYSPEKNFLRYLLYVTYFPHILQGPIARYDRLGVQFAQEHRFDYKRVCFGMQMIMWGFFQKLVIADRLNSFVSAAYGNYANEPGTILLIATLFYAIQIYTDFAGCVNIARGVSEIFGITLEDNFRQPYFARSVDEFWRRWHMTLGAWFKDYLCMPVSVSKPVKNLAKTIRKRFGSAAGKDVTTIAALIAVWTCTGVWHGTGLNYVVWGFWQGGIIILSLLLEPLYARGRKLFGIREESVEWKAFQMARTFVLTGIIPRVIVRASSLSAAAVIFKKILTIWRSPSLLDGSLLRYGMTTLDFVIIAFAVGLLLAVSIMKERGVSIRESVANMHIVVRWAIYLFIFYFIVIFGIYGPGYSASAFVYMGF